MTPVTPAAGGPVVIAPMTHGDLPAVLAIERAASPAPYTEGVFADELAHPESRCWLVARDGATGEVVGFCGFLYVLDEAHVANIAVREDQRRRGIAVRLLLAGVDDARRRGAQAVTLEVRASNHPAQRLYHRFGFAPSGIRPRYYTDNGEDAVIMWADDLQSDDMTLRLRRLAQEVAA